MEQNSKVFHIYPNRDFPKYPKEIKYGFKIKWPFTKEFDELRKKQPKKIKQGEVFKGISKEIKEEREQYKKLLFYDGRKAAEVDPSLAYELKVSECDFLGALRKIFISKKYEIIENEDALIGLHSSMAVHYKNGEFIGKLRWPDRIPENR